MELIDSGGKVVAGTRSDYDGFFLFERVPYGRYALRATTESAAAARIEADLAVTAVVTPDRSVVRTGSISVRPLPVVASVGPAGPTALK